MILQEFCKTKGLTEREAQIVGLVLKGLSNLEIASLSFVREKTIKYHLTGIYAKMNVKSRAQLIVTCLPFTYSLAISST